MIKVQASCLIYGESFSPRKFENKTGLKLSQTNEKGDIGKVGKSRNKPMPYGSGILEFPEDEKFALSSESKLLKALTGFIEEAKVAGAEDIDMYLNVEYTDQCNFTLEPEFLKIVSQLSIPVSISCYPASSEEV
jgi:hypothetical protein